MSVIHGLQSAQNSLKDKFHGCLINTQANTSKTIRLPARIVSVISAPDNTGTARPFI